MAEVSLNFLISVIAVLAVSMLIAVVGLENVFGVKDIIRKENMDVVGERIDTAIYATDSMERADVELKFKTEYELQKEGEDKYIVFTYLNEDERYRLQPGVPFSMEEGSASTFCLEKTTTVKLTPGGCSD